MIPMTIDECAALDRLLQYNWSDEVDDYRDHIEEHGAGCHIFEDMVTLDNYLAKVRGVQQFTAAEHLEGE